MIVNAFKELSNRRDCEIFCKLVHSTIMCFTDSGSSQDSQVGRSFITKLTSGYATWFTAGGAIRIAHYDVIDEVITRKL